MYLYCINIHTHGSLLFLICNDLLQRDLGIIPNISNFVELLPKFGYFFLLIIAHMFFFLLSFKVLFGLLLNEKKKKIINNNEQCNFCNIIRDC